MSECGLRIADCGMKKTVSRKGAKKVRGLEDGRRRAKDRGYRKEEREKTGLTQRRPNTIFRSYGAGKGTKGSTDYADLRRLKGNEGELPETEVPGFYRFGDTRNACSDISKIRALGWEPEMTPRDSVREYVAWLYEQDNVEDILAYAEKTMKEMNVVRRADVIG